MIGAEGKNRFQSIHVRKQVKFIGYLMVLNIIKATFGKFGVDSVMNT